MKKYSIAFLALLVSSFNHVYAGESKLTQWASKTTAKIVSGTKDVLTGVQKGMDTGRTSTTSPDGAIVIADGNYHNYLDIQVESGQAKAGGYEFTLVFRNKTDKIVRLTNLYHARNFYLVDNQGFTTSLLVDGDSADVTVLKNAATKKTYRFSTQSLSGKVVTLKLFENNIALP